MVERAIWRVVFRMALLGPDNIDNFLRAELPTIKEAMVGYEKALPCTDTQSQILQLPTPFVANVDSNYHVANDPFDVQSVITANLSRAIDKSLNAQKESAPTTSRSRKKGAHTSTTPSTAIDLTSARSSSDFIQALDEIYPQYWDDFRSFSAEVPKTEPIGNPLSLPHPDIGSVSTYEPPVGDDVGDADSARPNDSTSDISQSEDHALGCVAGDNCAHKLPHFSDDEVDDAGSARPRESTDDDLPPSDVEDDTRGGDSEDDTGESDAKDDMAESDAEDDTGECSTQDDTGASETQDDTGEGLDPGIEEDPDRDADGDTEFEEPIRERVAVDVSPRLNLIPKQSVTTPLLVLQPPSEPENTPPLGPRTEPLPIPETTTPLDPNTEPEPARRAESTSQQRQGRDTDSGSGQIGRAHV